MSFVQTYEKREFAYDTYNEYKSHRYEMEENGYILVHSEMDTLRGEVVQVRAAYEKDYSRPYRLPRHTER